MKHLRYIFLILCFAAVFGLTAAADDCHDYSEAWFGADRSDGSTLDLDAWEPSDGELTDLLDEYFLARQEDFTGGFSISTPRLMASADGATAQAAEARAALVAELEGRINANITDAEVTRFVLDVTTLDNGYEVEVYEWTFFDYDDLSDGYGGSDTAGFGTRHTLTLEYDGNGQLQIVSDLYAETDILGGGTLEVQAGEEHNPAELAASAANYDTNYDPIRAGIYANKWVTHKNIGSSTDSSFYNPAYPNLNYIGGDCANYVSQCLTAGNMTHTDSWYYKSGRYPSAWSYCPTQYKYFAQCGNSVWQPGDADIYPGAPIFCSSSTSYPPSSLYHVIICVGYNSAGRPVINGHNSDRYMMPWDYAYATNYLTVQLTPYRLEKITYTCESLFTFEPEKLTLYSHYAGGKVVSVDFGEEAYLPLRASFLYEGTKWYCLSWGDEYYYVNTLEGLQREDDREAVTITVPEAASNRETITVTTSVGATSAATLYAKNDGGKTYSYDLSSGKATVDTSVFEPGYVTFWADVTLDGVSLRSFVAYCYISELFTDVSGHWAEDIVYEAYDLGLFNGTSKNTFTPDGTMTRAMFVTVLGRMAGVDPSGYTNRTFDDLISGEYYVGYVAWATKNGIINGVTDSTFCPDSPVTREQAAAIIHRYLGYASVSLPDISNPAAPFTDMDSASAYAKEAIDAMRRSGLINGYPQGDYRPANSITRAEAAKIFLTLHDKLDT